ncbi:MAG: hypothetical protein AAGA77_02745 [Bacteroidota bacterium]
MKSLSILILGKNQSILETVVRLVNSREDWTGEGICRVEDLEHKLQEKDFNILLLGAGIDSTEEFGIRAMVNVTSPSTQIIQHYGGGSGLLYNEIQAVLDRQEV